MPGPLTRSLTSALRQAVEEQGLTQAQIAATLGQSQSQVSKYLRGEVVLNIEELNSICEILGVDTAKLIAVSLTQREIE